MYLNNICFLNLREQRQNIYRGSVMHKIKHKLLPHRPIVRVRYINILTWLRGFQDKLPYLVLLSLYPSLFWELRDKSGNLKNLQFWPESLGAMLEYWNIGRGLLDSGSYHLRKQEFVQPRFSSVAYGKHSLRYLGPKLWNDLTSRIRMLPSSLWPNLKASYVIMTLLF